MNRHSIYKYFGITLAVITLAGLEFAYEYLHGDAPDASLCVTPQSKREAIKETLQHHMRGH